MSLPLACLKCVLLHQVSLFLLFRLPGLILLLDVLNQPECGVQVRAGGADLTWLTNVSAAVSPKDKKAVNT